MSAAAYINWCKRWRVPRNLQTVEQCLSYRGATHLASQLKATLGDPPALEPLAALVATRSALPVENWRSETAEFVGEWARVSPAKTDSVDINESRFIKWAQADSWDAFIDATITGVRVLRSKNKTVGLRSVYNWIIYRHEKPDYFSLQAANNFYAIQDHPSWREKFERFYA